MSHTVEDMLVNIGTGVSGPSTQARLACSMVRDGARIPAVSAFASLGSHGRYAGNSERNMQRWLHNLNDIGLEPYDIKLNLLKPGEMIAEPTQVPCILPHEVIHSP